MAQKRKANAMESADAIDMLLQDHANVEQFFKQFEKLHAAGEDTAKVVDFVRLALLVHSTLEKELFYPAVRDLADEEIEELLDEAEVEHQSVDQLVAALRPRKLDEKKRDAHFTVLVEYVRHHVKEEEREMFPKVKRLKRLNLRTLGAAMAKRRLALHKRLKLPPF
jgi:hemerythrin superfamily protein